MTYMIKKILTAIALFCIVTAFGQNYTPTDAGSKVRFVIKNFGINTGGTFEGLAGTIVFDPANITGASFNVSVDAKTVDTDLEARDNHLRKEEYFDVEKYPRLSFKSTKITTTNKEGYLYMFGVITIKNISKEISFPFKQTSKDGGILFEGEFKLNRKDFGVGGSSFSMSDEVNLELSIFAKKS
ncbi:MAG: YceI family protein [Bacteroidetes bacterium]|nr:MAG: YceI family protein [Bacteroidota bacterium]